MTGGIITATFTPLGTVLIQIPEYHHLMDDMPPEVWEEFVRCATKMLKAAPSDAFLNIQDLLREYSDYQHLRGSFSPAVIALAKDQPAHLWWQQWGKSTPSLRYVATRALAQCVSASCSEQGWSEYDLVHCRRRNRLDKAYASNLTIARVRTKCRKPLLDKL